jgi:hypothetical protein
MIADAAWPLGETAMELTRKPFAWLFFLLIGLTCCLGVHFGPPAWHWVFTREQADDTADPTRTITDANAAPDTSVEHAVSGGDDTVQTLPKPHSAFGAFGTDEVVYFAPGEEFPPMAEYEKRRKEMAASNAYPQSRPSTSERVQK